MGQLSSAKTHLAQHTAAEEQNLTKQRMSERELGALETRWKAVEREAGEGERGLEKLRAEVGKLREGVRACGWSEEREREGEREVVRAKAIVRELIEVSRSSKGVYLTD
jgi:structural maintenance of chromosome 2